MERLVHKSQGLLNHPTKTIHGESGDWLMSVVQSIATVYNGALNEASNTFKQMNTTSKHVFEFIDQCNPNLKFPNQL
jgi:hypothetical protein